MTKLFSNYRHTLIFTDLLKIFMINYEQDGANIKKKFDSLTLTYVDLKIQNLKTVS